MAGTTKVRTVLALLAALLAGGIVTAAPASAATITTTLRAGIAGLPVT